MTSSPVPQRVVGLLSRFLAEAEPARVSTAGAADLVRAFVEIERLAQAGKTLFADRAAASGRWAEEGHDSASSWLADMAKTPIGEARSVLERSRALGDLPRTAQAVRSGGLSEAQVDEVTRAARKDPTAEAELLELAGSKSLKHLQHRARQVLAQAASREEEAARRERLMRRRFCRYFTDHEGALRLEARMTPEVGARLVSALEAEAEAVFREARSAGVREHPDAYRCDALVALVTGTARTAAGARAARRLGSRPESANGPEGGGSSSPRPRTDTVVVRVDAEALLRGYVQGGETCEIAGVGPVPVAAVRRILPSSWVKVVIRDSIDVRSVCHIGRAVPAALMTALEERDPRCVWPGCAVAHGLEAHHWKEDFSRCGTTSLDGLARVCQRHHDLITYGGWLLDGGPGRWRVHAPSAPTVFEEGDLEHLDTG
jgi:hypothetical protein